MSQKIHAGKQAQVTEDFMIIARLESLIAKQGLTDALDRAQAYIEAGADAIMIHSCESEVTEINEFCKAYQDLAGKVPLVAVPTTTIRFMRVSSQRWDLAWSSMPTIF